ncbi:glycoside hydrolase family 15 protein [Ktedonosporobacter rubrisoli]|uniref:Trehalase n=1 Tax=Ktedonosporobacter rubrisoli TaxID=2509675 RepID=A0A4V0YYY8_KTERU|nr:glycoside hydrolase family 15 protein [Ktedonosporobacter rubrisoli]QBD77871.1 glycoside hydrolase family 15 protein [Ktedonosporobacter rubrisoli]
MVGMNEINRSYQPINSYGVIGDCHSTVLISPDGSVDWGCLPDFDSPAIFCRLLDAEHGGYFQIAPTGGNIPGSQRYLRGSNVLQTRFASTFGEIVLTDFMPVETLEAWPYKAMNNNTWRAHEDGSCHCLVRIVECTHGEMPVTVSLKVSPDYAATPSEVALIADNKGAMISSAQQHVALAMIGADLLASCTMDVAQAADEWHQTITVQATLREGERLLFALGMGRSAQAARRLVEVELHQRNFDVELAHTLHCWRQWLAGCTYQGPYSEWVHRSALALKMMTYAPTGAIVAAPTTSLPEELGGVRNWDYRFTWLRDATFTLYALNVLGFTAEARAFTHWLRNLSYTDGEDLQIMYGIRGERELAEQELHHLSGYCGSSPVRIGNAAAQQKQMDVFGEVLDCIHLYRRQGGFERYGEKLEGPLWQMMQTLVEHVCAHWQEPDSGIWEVRGGLRHYVYSKVMCWVALDRGIRAAQQLNLDADLPRWIMIRDQIRADILCHGYDTSIGAFTQSYGSAALDASTLLLPLVGFIPPDDPRMRSTVDRIMESLTDKHGFVYRYLSDDGLSGGEGTFTLCTFWLVDNLAMQGRLDEARSLFERLLTYAGRLGLFSEEIEAQSNEALGNYPQAFTHIALINSAQNLRKAEIRLSEHHTDPVIAAIRLQKR